MKFPRRAGILLHPTSLPGRHGIGDLGPEAFRFVDWLAEAGQRLWQVLPLGPTGYGDSPYQSFSAFAGNPLLISLERLADEGLLDPATLDLAPAFPADQVDFAVVQAWKGVQLRAAFAASRQREQEGLTRWVKQNAEWLDAFALFIALKEHFGGGAWLGWPEPLRRRDPQVLNEWRVRLAEEIAFQMFLQYQFFQQWVTLRAYARRRGIAIVGDIPIFIAHDSADAWTQREQFYIQDDGSLEVQAGVPPDYFSATGQLWGNPLYRWDAMQARGYDWWITRFRATLNLVDVVRLDHFRGFEAYWAVPGDAPTAERGEWRKGPGPDLFRALHAALGELPLIAEDLGVITPEVVALRDEFDYPGMRIFQFAFTADTTSAFLPHNFDRNTVAYTGTHDNETTRGWYGNLDTAGQRRVRAYLGTEDDEVVRAMVRALTASVADTAIIPMQDVLDLDNRARMNLPGQPGGNWQWRATPDQFTSQDAAWLAELARVYER